LLPIILLGILSFEIFIIDGLVGFIEHGLVKVSLEIEQVFELKQLGSHRPEYINNNVNNEVLSIKNETVHDMSRHGEAGGVCE